MIFYCLRCAVHQFGADTAYGTYQETNHVAGAVASGCESETLRRPCRPWRDPGLRVWNGSYRFLTGQNGRSVKSPDLREILPSSAYPVRMPPPGIEPGHAV